MATLVPVSARYEQDHVKGLTERWAIRLPIALGSSAIAVWSWLAFFRPLGPQGIIWAAITGALAFACFSVTSLLVAMLDGSGSRTLRRELAKCSMAFALLFLFLPEYTARVRPPVLRSSLLLVTLTTLWLALYHFCRREAEGIRDWAERKTYWPLATLAILSITLTGLAIRKFYVFGYVGQDLAYFAQIMHTTLQGHLFWGSLLQDLLYSYPVTTDFAGHNSPIMFLFLPFYGLFPSPVTLLVLRNAAMLACCYPVYKIARTYCSESTSRLWSLVFFLVPTIFYQSTFDFYPLSFVALPLLFAVYFFQQSRFLPFCVALAFTLAVREDLAIFALALSIVALIQRRSIRWIGVPFVAGLAWAYISYVIVLPYALHGSSFVTDACFSHLGATPTQMLAHVCSSPQSTLLTRGNIVYLKELLTPTALVLSFGNALVLASLPFVGINLAAGAGKCITTVIYAQYSVIPAVLLFASALLAGARTRGLLKGISRLWIRSNAVAPAICLALCVASLVFVTGEDQASELRSKPWTQEARQVAQLIPTGASVAAPRYLLPSLANRDCLYQTHRLSQYHHPVYEYLILDTDWSHINASQEYRTAYAALLENAPKDPTFRVLYKSSQFTVLQNPAAHGQSCFPVEATR